MFIIAAWLFWLFWLYCTLLFANAILLFSTSSFTFFQVRIMFWSCLTFEFFNILCQMVLFIVCHIHIKLIISNIITKCKVIIFIMSIVNYFTSITFFSSILSSELIISGFSYSFDIKSFIDDSCFSETTVVSHQLAYFLGLQLFLLLFKDFSKWSIYLVLLFGFVQNIPLPVRYSYLLILPDDITNIFAVSPLMSYWSFNLIRNGIQNCKRLFLKFNGLFDEKVIFN